MSWGRKIHKSDRASWRTHGSVAVGTVRRKIAEGTRAIGRPARASSRESPQEGEIEKAGGRHTAHTRMPV
ncbi:MAG: DUF2945 domain-containing protein [Streptomyces sp.]